MQLRLFQSVDFQHFGYIFTLKCVLKAKCLLDIICSMSKKKREQKNPGQVIFPVNHPNPPEQHEVDVAHILARHYRTTVEFLVPIDDYKRKSADIVMNGVAWEIKCPTGNSKSTISGQFQRASKQSKNLILDTRRTKLEYEIIEKRVRIELKKRAEFKRVLLIDKFEKVVEICK